MKPRLVKGLPVSKRPRVNPPTTLTPVLGKEVKPDEKGWVFSMQHWKQIEYFGLGKCEKNWYVSLLERLQDLSKQKLSSFFLDRTTAKHYRFHPIDWSHKNCPIKKSDLDWIDEDIRFNEEFEFHQITISQALGRVVGFFNREVFYIVLLDPLHNIQPAGGKYNYRVDKTTVAGCTLSAYIKQVSVLGKRLSSCTQIDDAKAIAGELRTLQVQHISDIGVLHFLTEDDAVKIEEIIVSGKAADATEILLLGLECYQEG